MVFGKVLRVSDCVSFVFWLSDSACLWQCSVKKLWLIFYVLSNTKHSLFSCNSSPLAIPIISIFRRRFYYFLIVIISMIHDFLSFYIVVSKCEDWKEKAFLWSVPGDIHIPTPLQLSMRWDITSLVQSVNLICAKNVYYSNRLKYFFLCVNSRITSNIFKTCFGQNEKFGWM